MGKICIYNEEFCIKNEELCIVTIDFAGEKETAALFHDTVARVYRIAEGHPWQLLGVRFALLFDCVFDCFTAVIEPALRLVGKL